MFDFFKQLDLPPWNPYASPFSSWGHDFQKGHLFIGVADTYHFNVLKDHNKWLDHGSNFTGIAPDKHMLTIAGARSGKGAALIINNLRTWNDNVLTIDVKGENVEASWTQREREGHKVYALDPFHAANIPDRLRASFNPLDLIDPDSRTAREDVLVIADGMVVRHNPNHAQWDEGAANLLAGLIAFVAGSAPPEQRNLLAVRDLLQENDEALAGFAEKMQTVTRFDGLAKSAGSTILSGINEPRSMSGQYLERAKECIGWLQSEATASVIESSDFDLRDIRRGDASIYLVLPPQYMATQATFLRLFVRLAMNVMAADGPLRKNDPNHHRCLFILDEFFPLGRIDAIATGMGLMPGYGLHIWPFLQDLGQLQSLYGDKGSETFFANADAAIFFGNTDMLTLEYISNRIGKITPEDLSLFYFREERKPYKESDRWFWQNRDDSIRRHEASEITKENKFRDKSSLVGQIRCAPDDVMRMVAKADNGVAKAMIVFKNNGVFAYLLQPYFGSSKIRNNPRHMEKYIRNRNIVIGAIFLIIACYIGFYTDLLTTLIKN